MKYFWMIIFTALCLDVFPQHQESINKIPILIPTYSNKDIKWKSPRIYDCCVLDSLKVFYKVIVQFRYPFAELNKEIIVDNVSLSQIIILEFKTGANKITLNPNNKNITPFQRCIWNICSDKLLEWYKYQPYKEYYYNRDTFQGKRMSFSGMLYIIPKKEK